MDATQMKQMMFATFKKDFQDLIINSINVMEGTYQSQQIELSKQCVNVALVN